MAALTVVGSPEKGSQDVPAPRQNPSYFNPQMAIVGDFAATLADRRGERRHADFREIEFGFKADADPFLTAEAYLGLHKEDGESHLEVEEAFGRYSNLGRGLSAKFGKFAAAFGRVQRNHTDQLNYLNYPLPIQDIFGEEGLRNVGGSFSYLFPGSRFSELTLEVLDVGNEGPVFNNSDFSNPAYVAHYRTFFDFSEDVSGQLGFSYLSAPSLPGGSKKEIAPQGIAARPRRGDAFGVDYTMKWQPGGGRQTMFEAEAFWTKPGGFDERAFGVFGRVAHEFRPRWFLTAGYDYSEIPSTEDKHHAWIGGVTLKVTEFHHWRLVFEKIVSNFERDRNVLTLQFQWVIGSHPAHRY
jgi:hypothetical protein